MRVGHLTASGYGAEGAALRVTFVGAALEQVEGLEGLPFLTVTTEQGEVVEYLRGYTRLSSVLLDRETGDLTAVFRHVSETETALAALRAQVTALEGTTLDTMVAVAELGGMVAAGMEGA